MEQHLGVEATSARGDLGRRDSPRSYISVHCARSDVDWAIVGRRPVQRLLSVCDPHGSFPGPRPVRGAGPSRPSAYGVRRVIWTAQAGWHRPSSAGRTPRRRLGERTSLRAARRRAAPQSPQEDLRIRPAVEEFARQRQPVPRGAQRIGERRPAPGAMADGADGSPPPPGVPAPSVASASSIPSPSRWPSLTVLEPGASGPSAPRPPAPRIVQDAQERRNCRPSSAAARRVRTHSRRRAITSASSRDAARGADSITSKDARQPRWGSGGCERPTGRGYQRQRGRAPHRRRAAHRTGDPETAVPVSIQEVIRAASTRSTATAASSAPTAPTPQRQHRPQRRGVGCARQRAHLSFSDSPSENSTRRMIAASSSPPRQPRP